MGRKRTPESIYQDKILVYSILKYMESKKFIQNNECLNDEYNIQAKVIKYKLEISAFSTRYRNLLKKNKRIFKVNFPSYGHIIFFANDILYLYQKKILKLNYDKLLWLINPKYSYIDSKLIIQLRCRRSYMSTYLETFISRCSLIFYEKESFLGNKYLLYFSSETEYNTFKLLLETYCSPTKKHFHTSIANLLQENVKRYAEEIHNNYKKIHTSDYEYYQQLLSLGP